MPAACAADLREELLARVWGPTIRAASRQDAHLRGEIDALEAAGDLTPPDEWEPCEYPPKKKKKKKKKKKGGGKHPLPGVRPAGRGLDAWLADLPAELLSEYIAATEDQPCQEAIVAGRLPRQPGDGCGFAAGGVADEVLLHRDWSVSPVTHGPAGLGSPQRR